MNPWSFQTNLFHLHHCHWKTKGQQGRNRCSSQCNFAKRQLFLFQRASSFRMKEWSLSVSESATALVNLWQRRSSTSSSQLSSRSSSSWKCQERCCPPTWTSDTQSLLSECLILLRSFLGRDSKPKQHFLKILLALMLSLSPCYVLNIMLWKNWRPCTPSKIINVIIRKNGLELLVGCQYKGENSRLIFEFYFLNKWKILISFYLNKWQQTTNE